jgi:hypothetical protein
LELKFDSQSDETPKSEVEEHTSKIEKKVEDKK